MPADSEIIILKRVEEAHEGKHGGVWKIAHADFMTAMMAFFLIMWLVNATDEEIKKSIANYFNPMNLVTAPTSQRGLSEPDKETTPSDSTEAEGSSPSSASHGSSKAAGDYGDAHTGGNVEEGNDKTMASAGRLASTDNADFNDPYAELASAASDIAPDTPTAVDTPDSTLGETSTTAANEDTRDPFDPAYWQTLQSRPTQTLRPGHNGSDTLPENAQIDAAAASPRGTDEEASEHPPQNAAERPGTAKQNASKQPAQQAVPESIRNAAGPRSSLAEQILMEEANAKQAEQAASNQAAAKKSEEDKAEAVRQELAQALEGVSAEIAIAPGTEAVSVSLTDDNLFSMFAIGSAAPTQEALELFARVGRVLAEREGRIIVRGHTDARPFRSGSSDNWVLSFERAYATKNALVDTGIAEDRFSRVEGLADREPKQKDDPLADENRRIEILYEPVNPNP